MKTKIDSTNLVPFVGQTVNLYCQVGVMLNLRGKLIQNYGFCLYAIELPLNDGARENAIGFSFGEFSVNENNEVSIFVS